MVHSEGGRSGAHLAGLIDWLGKLAPEHMPAVVVDLIFPPGMDPKPGSDNTIWDSRDPREDARAVFYRHIGLRLKAMNLTRLRFISAHPDLTKIYLILLFAEVAYTPAQPFAVPKFLRDRTGARPITVGVVGHQHPDKGYAFMPEVFTALLKARNDIRILVHNSGPAKFHMADTERALAELAAREPRLTLRHTALSPDEYQSLQASIDLMLCPYDPRVHKAGLSGVVMECLINAIPVVLPGNTINSDQFQIFGPSGVAFESFDAASITAAALKALDRFDDHAAAAVTTAHTWARDRNPGKFVEEILRLGAQSPAS